MNLRKLTVVLAALVALATFSNTAEAKHRYHHHHSYRQAQQYDDGSILHGRPSGCPHRYCGCEASLFLFGRIIPDLNLASNWYRRFPRTAPAPHMAAARDGHVMVLLSHVEGNNWLVHDGNSGRGLTREHVRSIAGYAIVDPNGNRMAATTTTYHARSKRYTQVAQVEAVDRLTVH